jgi:hypothetical protein
MSMVEYVEKCISIACKHHALFVIAIYFFSNLKQTIDCPINNKFPQNSGTTDNLKKSSI